MKTTEQSGALGWSYPGLKPAYHGPVCYLLLYNKLSLNITALRKPSVHRLMVSVGQEYKSNLAGFFGLRTLIFASKLSVGLWSHLKAPLGVVQQPSLLLNHGQDPVPCQLLD
jgi:hypothetical protein